MQHIRQTQSKMDKWIFNKYLHDLENFSSYEALYKYYFKRIVFHLSRTYGLQIAEDAAQSFFSDLKFIAAKQSYVEFPTSWVYKCCENIAKRLISKENKYAEIGADVSCSSSYDERELYGDLYDEIKSLDDISRNIIMMYYWEGYGLYEVSKLLGINYNTVRQKHRRALKKIQKCFYKE